MFEWGHPVWLLALILIPFIWWLHRFKQHPANLPVSALFLWSGHEEPPHEGKALRSDQTDPIWWQQALLALLMILSLANPSYRQTAHADAEIWFDDSLSMLAKEGQDTRNALAIEKLATWLASHAPTRLFLHSLTKPSRDRDLGQDWRDHWRPLLNHWGHSPGKTIIIPETSTMDAGSIHCLVSDGATAKIKPWLAITPVTCLITVGQTSNNMSIDNLATRVSNTLTGATSFTVSLSNHGDHTRTRRLTLTWGKSKEVRNIQVPPRQTQHMVFSLPTQPNARLTARMTPADALVEDDMMTIDPQQFSVAKILVAGNCPDDLMHALQVHPGIHLSKRKGAEFKAIIYCGNNPVPSVKIPRLWVHLSNTKTTRGKIRTQPTWSDQALTLRNIRLKPDWIDPLQPPSSERKDQAILWTAQQTLISRTSSSRPVIKVFFDLSSTTLTQEPAYPLLIAGLLDLTLGQNLLDGITRSSRPTASSHIKPRQLQVKTQAETQRPLAAKQTLSPYLIMLAIALMLFIGPIPFFKKQA